MWKGHAKVHVVFFVFLFFGGKALLKGPLGGGRGVRQRPFLGRCRFCEFSQIKPSFQRGKLVFGCACVV